MTIASGIGRVIKSNTSTNNRVKRDKLTDGLFKSSRTDFPGASYSDSVFTTYGISVPEPTPTAATMKPSCIGVHIECAISDESIHF